MQAERIRRHRIQQLERRTERRTEAHRRGHRVKGHRRLDHLHSVAHGRCEGVRVGALVEGLLQGGDLLRTEHLDERLRIR